MGRDQKKCGKVKKTIIKPVAVLFAFIAFPFILDRLYGCGALRWIPNSFSGDIWFSFIGSYVPASIIGILTLYQAHIIHEQEREYKKLLNRHRFIPDSHVIVYRYDETQETNSFYNFDKVEQILVRSGREELEKKWKTGYLMECNLHNASDIEIGKAKVKEIEWEINGNRYVQQDSEKMAVIVDRISHSKQKIVIFWQFDEMEKAGEEIARCMFNEPRFDIRYEISDLMIRMQIVDDEEETCDLKMRCRLQSLNDNYKMASMEETCYVE